MHSEHNLANRIDNERSTLARISGFHRLRRSPPDSCLSGRTSTEQILRLPYKDGETFFTVILPQPNVDLRDVQAKLVVPGGLQRLQDQMEDTRVDLSMPKFHLAQSASLEQALTKV